MIKMKKSTLVGADRLVASPVHLIKLPGQSTVQMLHRRHSRRDHLEGRIESIEVEVDAAHDHASDKPQLERYVR
jgi:hypothetical protein